MKITSTGKSEEEAESLRRHIVVYQFSKFKGRVGGKLGEGIIVVMAALYLVVCFLSFAIVFFFSSL